MKEATVRARVEPELKEDAERILAELGITTTEAIRMFLSQIRIQRAIPFEVGLGDNSDLLRSDASRQAALDTLYDD